MDFFERKEYGSEGKERKGRGRENERRGGGEDGFFVKRKE